MRLALTVRVSCAVLLVAVASTSVRAGEPFVVAAESSSSHRTAPVGSGEFVVSWLTVRDPDTDRLEVHGRHFVAETGGTEFPISQFLQEDIVWHRDLDLLGDRLLALWNVSPSGGPLHEQRAIRSSRRERGGGLPDEGTRRRTLTTTGVPLSDEEVARGSLAVALPRQRYALFRPETNAEGIRVGVGQVFDANDQRVSNPFEYTAHEAPSASDSLWNQEVLAMDDGLLVLWIQEQDFNVRNLYAQAFSTLGVALGELSVIAEEVDSAAALAPAGDGWQAAWLEGDTVYTQRLSPLGQPAGEVLEVRRAAITLSISITGDATGSLLAWSEIEHGALGDSTTFWVSRLDASGRPLGAATPLMETDGFSHIEASALGDGTAVLVWGEPSKTRIMGLLVALAPLFADGFESGNTSAWSAVVP